MKDVRVDKNNQVDIRKSLDDEINKRVKEYKNGRSVRFGEIHFGGFTPTLS